MDRQWASRWGDDPPSGCPRKHPRAARQSRRTSPRRHDLGMARRLRGIGATCLPHAAFIDLGRYSVQIDDDPSRQPGGNQLVTARIHSTGQREWKKTGRLGTLPGSTACCPNVAERIVALRNVTTFAVRIAVKLFTFDELRQAYHRLSDETVALASIGARAAYLGLAFANTVGALQFLRRQYLIHKPIAPASAPANHVYDAHYLQLRLNRIYDMPDVVVDTARPRTVNVLVPAFDFRSMSAGFFGVFQTALFFGRLGFHVRLVLFDNFYFDRDKFRELLAGYPGLEELFDRCETEYIGERKAPLAVNPADICVATVWYSAYFAEKIHRSLDRKDFIYLIQDYEAAFYPGSSASTQADLSYDMNYTPLFSSRSLRDQFLKADIGGLASGQRPTTYFNNACSSSLPQRQDFLAAKRLPRRKRLAFYSRPVVDRNMFELAALVLAKAFERGILNAEEWDCFGMGLGEGVVQLAEGLTTTTLPRMNLTEYLATVPSFDLCLTLMASPHPSMIPMDLGCSGAIVVTNTFQTKTSEYLTSLCENIISAPPHLDALLDALAEAVRRTDDLEARYDAAKRSTFPRDWAQSFTAEHEAFFRMIINGETGREHGTLIRRDTASTVAATQRLFSPPLVEQPQRTYVMVGNGRGGTSMAAGLMVALGSISFLGGIDQCPNYEDRELVKLAQGRDANGHVLNVSQDELRSRLLELIDRRNAFADVWGWKDPSADLYLESIIGKLRNPHIIFVTRDPGAVALAHAHIHGVDTSRAFTDATARLDRYWAMIQRLGLPTLLVSYERGKRQPQELLAALGDFTGIAVSTEARQAAAAFVSEAGGYRLLNPLGSEPYLTR